MIYVYGSMMGIGVIAAITGYVKAFKQFQWRYKPVGSW